MAEQLEIVLPESEEIQEVVTDKGYHGTERIVDMNRLSFRTNNSEPKRKRSCWKGDREAQAIVNGSRSRNSPEERVKAQFQLRGERLERPFVFLERDILEFAIAGETGLQVKAGEPAGLAVE